MILIIIHHLKQPINYLWKLFWRLFYHSSYISNEKIYYWWKKLKKQHFFDFFKPIYQKLTRRTLGNHFDVTQKLRGLLECINNNLQNLDANAKPIFLKNSRYSLQKQHFLAIFGCFLAPLEPKNIGRAAGGGHMV